MKFFLSFKVWTEISHYPWVIPGFELLGSDYKPLPGYKPPLALVGMCRRDSGTRLAYTRATILDKINGKP